MRIDSMKKIFSKMDKPLLFITIVLFVFGLIMVLSASSMESYMRYGSSPYYYFYKQAIFIFVGSILFFILIRIPTKVYKGFSYIFNGDFYDHTFNSADKGILSRSFRKRLCCGARKF